MLQPVDFSLPEPGGLNLIVVLTFAILRVHLSHLVLKAFEAMLQGLVDPLLDIIYVAAVLSLQSLHLLHEALTHVVLEGCGALDHVL